MKKESITFYNCDFCLKKFENKEDCEAHEIEHTKNKARDNLLYFKLKPEHVKLLINMYVDWNDCEFGAPCINPKRPYGNSSVVDDIAEILDVKKTKDNVEGYNKEEVKEYSDKNDYINELDWNKEIFDYLMDIHKETQIALQIVLKNKSFQLGVYKREDKYGNDWKLIEGEK